MSDFLVAIGLVLVIEGLLWALFRIGSQTAGCGSCADAPSRPCARPGPQLLPSEL